MEAPRERRVRARPAPFSASHLASRYFRRGAEPREATSSVHPHASGSAATGHDCAPGEDPGQGRRRCRICAPRHAATLPSATFVRFKFLALRGPPRRRRPGRVARARTCAARVTEPGGRRQLRTIPVRWDLAVRSSPAPAGRCTAVAAGPRPPSASTPSPRSSSTACRTGRAGTRRCSRRGSSSRRSAAGPANIAARRARETRQRSRDQRLQPAWPRFATAQTAARAIPASSTAARLPVARNDGFAPSSPVSPTSHAPWASVIGRA